MSKKKDRFKINFVGNNSMQVTGSCTHIEMNDKQILLECGLSQGKTTLEDYKNNIKKFGFTPSKIDYVFVGHGHIDHIGLLPRLVREGFQGRIIVPKGNRDIIYELCKDCAFIMSKDIEALKKKYKDKQFLPAYELEDIAHMMELIDEYDFSEKLI